ncbi:lycopene cyclase family protein [Ilumatobacter nonamiensis]|uniref:lycopene cyclase family protein n=1 Tax=Ilumatobacter nonamiensis TaxID=467093 RepID=UPI00034CC611|nr:lycopene cyclase family protein [Ilumatobacter nonamiensis]
MGSSDVAVVGDGPAGSALAQALRRRGVAVVLVGGDRPWNATYTTWVDDLDGVDVVADRDIWLQRFDSIAAHFDDAITIDREYGVLDNERLRSELRDGVPHRTDVVVDVHDLDARIVIDATGWPSGLDPTDRSELATAPNSRSWQTALGVVLPERPEGSLGTPTMMDYRSPPDAGSVEQPTFAYSLPVSDGWLVEETVLAGPVLDPDQLIERLASRLDSSPDQLLERALRIERVRIPMGAPVPARGSTVPGAVRFGAAAGMIHTATGYSVASSLRAADRVASAIAERLDRPADRTADHRAVADAVWPIRLRRSRRLHDYGLAVLLDMDAAQIRRFFQTFFELPADRWPTYLRVDAAPRDVAAVMTTMFRRADFPLRRRLVTGNPLTLLSALRP